MSQASDYDEDEVMKLVGTAFDGAADKPGRKRAFSNDEPMSQIEFQRWTAGLLGEEYEESETKSGQSTLPDAGTGAGAGAHAGVEAGVGAGADAEAVAGAGAGAAIVPAAASPRPTQPSHSTSKIDPDLGSLDDESSFVQDAIIDARVLANIGGLGQEYLRQATDIRHTPTPEEEVQHLAVQAVRQAVADAGSGNIKKQHSSGLAIESEAGIAAAMAEAAEQVVRATSGKSGREKDDDHISLLVDAAAERAHNMLPDGHHGKRFSNDEKKALDSFVKDYCKIKGLTVDDIRKRVWGNKRKKDSFWEILQKVLPSRNRASLYKHIRRTYHVFKVRATWNTEEDTKLAELAENFQGKWKLVGKEMGRMPEDCRDRWRNYIKCGSNRKKNKWDIQEEIRLKEAIKKFDVDGTPINWTQVSEMMGGTRSRIQCRYKWKKIMKRETVMKLREMDLDTKVWLLSRLREIWYHEKDDLVDWDALATVFPGKKWTGTDFQTCFDKMRASENFRGKSFIETVEVLLKSVTPSSEIRELLNTTSKGEHSKIPGLVLKSDIVKK
ncbi:hypothetical protein FOA43_001776 [Brettanomyces nanus]|uniref:DNA-binding protein REB1 n=1 Tax=Eeniella nana TaxID=13502 RepID=A0A875RUD2_EENNA|nr:uncharacterized protein FOA43_001776 [Brettanomyces nanus]QPG74447.1 hypothetical protein FOA43_001776 [Brettanomyces nanus]